MPPLLKSIAAWFGGTLTRKFVLLFAGFLVLQAVQMSTGIFGILHMDEEEQMVLGYARQRMLLMQVAVLARKASAPGAGWEQRRERLRGAIGEIDGYYADVTAAPGERMSYRWYSTHPSDLFNSVRGLWRKELKPLLEKTLISRPEAAAVLISRYEDLALMQVGQIDQVVLSMGTHISKDVRELAWFHALTLGLSVALLIAGVFMGRKLVITPLGRLIGASDTIASGGYDRRVAVVSRDEIGRLGETFNRMAAAVGDKTRRLMAFNKVAAAVTSSLSLREILEQVMYHGVDVSGAKAACIALYDEQEGHFKEWYTHGLSDHFVKNISFSPGGLADKVFTTGGHIISNDNPGTQYQLSRLARAEGIRSFVCLPLMGVTSRLGVIYFYHTDRDDFPPDEVELLKAFAHLAAGAMENARLYAQVENQARTDTLTALPNRRWFEQRLEEELRRAQRYKQNFSLMLLDADRFKDVNDRHGHPAGDAVLKELARILAQQVRDVDFAARVGGEEFAVVLPETDHIGAKLVAERVRRAVAGAPLRPAGGPELDMTVSIGVACFPACGETIEDIVAHADQALYTAKQEGRNRVCLYQEILKVQLEREPGRIAELLNQSLENIAPILTAVSAKSAIYRHHNELVERSALRLADELGLAQADREALRLACVLHDIGMIVVPDAVLNARTPLAPERQGLIRQHPARGAGFLEHVPALRHIAPIVRHHHERHDGGGYPDGLKGEAIPYLARVLAVADAYGSAVTGWLEHDAIAAPRARTMIAAGAGSQFDPEIAAAFVRLLDTETAAVAS